MEKRLRLLLNLENSCSQSGYFLSKVNAIKQTTSTVFAQVDSGFNHLIRPMLYGFTAPHRKHFKS